MTFETDLKAHLQADATIVALVADRIFPQIVPEGEAMPALTYTLAFGAPQNSLDGFTSDTTRYVVQLDCWGLTHEARMNLAIAVRNRLGTTASTIKQIVVTEFPIFDDYEPDTKRFRRAIQIAAWHTE